MINDPKKTICSRAVILALVLYFSNRLTSTAFFDWSENNDKYNNNTNNKSIK